MILIAAEQGVIASNNSDETRQPRSIAVARRAGSVPTG